MLCSNGKSRHSHGGNCAWVRVCLRKRPPHKLKFLLKRILRCNLCTECTLMNLRLEYLLIHIHSHNLISSPLVFNSFTTNTTSLGPPSISVCPVYYPWCMHLGLPFCQCLSVCLSGACITLQIQIFGQTITVAIVPQFTSKLKPMTFDPWHRLSSLASHVRPS